MKKRILIFALVTAMVGSILSGCGSKERQSGEETASLSQSQAQEDSSAEAVTETPVLTVWSYWPDIMELYPNQGDTPFWQAVEESVGVDLEFIDSTGGSEALSILIGTDDLPDIVIEQNANLPGGVQQQLVQGNIIAISDMMEAGYMPNFKDYMESDDEVEKLNKNEDGVHVWVPMIREEGWPLVFAGNIVRQDWLDELELKQPVTLEDMENVLMAFKEKKGCDVGYSFAFNEYDKMVNVFGVEEGMYVGTDGKVHYGVIEEGYLEFLTTFNRWMENGILDPDGFTQEIDSFYAKIATGRTGLVYGFAGSTLRQINQIQQSDSTMNMQPISYPIRHKNGEFLYDFREFRTTGTVGGMISTNCENKEAAARVLDYLFSEEGFVRTNFGEEGVTYEIVNGEYQFTDLVQNNPDGLSASLVISIYGGHGNKPGIVAAQQAKAGYSLDVQKLALDKWMIEGDPVAGDLPLLMLAEAEAEEYNSIMNEVKTYVDELKLKFIFGTEPLENYPDFVETIKKMDIERAIEIQQAAYDNFLAR